MINLGGRQCPVDIPAALGNLGRDVAAAEDDFQRPPLADQAWQADSAAGAGGQPDADFRLTAA